MLLRYSCPSIKAEFEPCRELLRVAFPLFGSEGDEGGRAEQELVHLEQLLSQGVEMGTQVYTSFARSACLPMRIDLAGVDGEAAVQAVFVRTEEAEELFGSARYGQCQVRVGHDYRITVRLVRLRDFFVVGGFAEDVLVLAVVLGERGNKGVDFGRCHVAAEFAVGGELFQQAALAGGGGGFQILALGLLRASWSCRGRGVHAVPDVLRIPIRFALSRKPFSGHTAGSRSTLG